MKNAENVEKLVETMCRQLHSFLRAGSTEDEFEARHRMAFAVQIERYLAEWAASDPDPVEYHFLHRRWAELQEGHLVLNTLAQRDLYRLNVDPAGSTPLASYKPQVIRDFEKCPLRVPPAEELEAADAGLWTFEPGELWFDPADCESNIEFAKNLSINKTDEELVEGFLNRFHLRDPMTLTLPGSAVAPRRSQLSPHARPLQPQAVNTHQAANLMHQLMSEVLKRFLENQEKANGDNRAASDSAPIVKFAIALWGDPVMSEVTGEQILTLMESMTDIPSLKGFSQGERDLYFRYVEAKACNFRRLVKDKVIELERVSEGTLRNRYKVGLTKFFDWAIKFKFYQGPLPDFDFSTPLNPGKTERDSFRHEEIVKFLSSPLFTGCQSHTRMWEVGDCFFQSFFYWAILISLLCGLRPGETGQLRCRDVLDLYEKPHFRFAKEDESKAKRKAKGGKQGKTPNAYRWVPIHPLLLELGLLQRRDAILAVYVERETKAVKKQLSEVEIQAIKDLAEDQWLFPDWRVSVPSTGVIKWSHAVSRAWQYVQEKFELNREGLAFYSARHTFKGFLDEVKGLSDRSRRVISGHSTNVDVHGGYGPKMITEAQMEVALALDNKTIQAVSEILLKAYKKALAGELRIIDAWKIDERSGDKKFQVALAKRSEQYR